MSIRHLDFFFEPRSVAVIGASERPRSVGATVWHNLGAGGYAGALYAVNPKHGKVGTARCWPDVASLPAAPELAVVCTPPAAVPGLIDQLGRAGTKAAIVLSAGLDEAQEQAMLTAARSHLLRIVGPGALGVLAPHAGRNASFAHTGAAAGTLAFVSQSGSVASAMLDWARGRGIGFSQLVSLGEAIDVDFGDMLDWLASDPHTRAVLLHVESMAHARKFPLRRVRPRQAAGLQLQAPGILPLLRRPAHVADRCAPGRPRHPARAGAAMGAVAADPAARAAGRAAGTGHAGAAGGAARGHATSAAAGGAQG